MGRLRVPTAVLDARGSFIANPCLKDKRVGEPMPDRPLGDAPERLGEDCKAVWSEIAAQLAPGVACISDRQMFEVLCLLINKLRKNTIRMMELTCLISLCGKFGMSPSDRSKVVVNAEPSNALTRFLQTYKAGEPS